MKKFICILFVMCLPITSFSQIQKTFWGLSLGESTKQQVFDTMIENGYKGRIDPDNDFHRAYLKNFSFEGGTWQFVYFYFVDDKLSKVSFEYAESDSSSHAKDMFRTITDSMNKKYAAYSGYANNNDGMEFYIYSDGKTAALIQRDFNPISNMQYVHLTFRDIKLEKQKTAKYPEPIVLDDIIE